MLTDKQLSRLPGTARAIVDTDRQITAITNRVVTPFAAADRAKLRELQKDRRTLTTRAHQIWGQPIRGDGTNQA